MQPFYVRSGCESISRVNNGKKINYNFKRNTVGTRPYNVRGRNTSYVFKPPPRHKHKLDPESLKILDAFFQQNRHPTVVEKMELANKCGLPSQTVTVCCTSQTLSHFSKNNGSQYYNDSWFF
jgi:hypothetical protein